MGSRPYGATGSIRKLVLNRRHGAEFRLFTAGWRPEASEPHTKEPVMKKGITYVGLDAHKKAIAVAVYFPGRQRPEEVRIVHEAKAVARWARKLRREAPGRVVCAYEAGPCGYALQRRLVELGLECQVVAPGLVPVKPGERVKTDRQDARKLGELLRGGLLTEVHPPTREEEAVRDLCRCREDAKQDLTRCRHRLTKLLLRRGITWTRGRKHWTQAHRAWLRTLRLEQAADQATLEDYLLAIEQVDERVRALNQQLEAVSTQEPYRKAVGWLRCFRGIDTVTALTVVAELHDFRRFQTARDLMGYLGLVPSEHSSSDQRRLGGITKAGNAHVRRVLIEAAWHYRHPPRVSYRLRKRREGQPALVIALADRAQSRLHRRYRWLSERGKAHNKIVVAVARELVGFLWAALSPRELETARAA
jgi:transposase